MASFRWPLGARPSRSWHLEADAAVPREGHRAGREAACGKLAQKSSREGQDASADQADKRFVADARGAHHRQLRPHKQDLADCDLIVEAIVENLDVEERALSRRVRPASARRRRSSPRTPASFPIDEMARGQRPTGANGRPALLQPGAADAPGRGRAHGQDLDEEVFAAARSFGEACGKDAGLLQGHAGLRREPPAGALHGAGAT